MSATTLLLPLRDLRHLIAIVRASLLADAIVRDVPDRETRALQDTLAAHLPTDDKVSLVHLSHVETLELKSIVTAMETLGIERFPELAETLGSNERLGELALLVWDRTQGRAAESPSAP